MANIITDEDGLGRTYQSIMVAMAWVFPGDHVGAGVTSS